MDVHPQLFDRQKSLSLEPLVGHAGLGSEGASQSPGSLTAHCHGNGRRKRGAEPEKLTHFRAGTAPLLPVTHAHATSNPVIDFGNWPVVVGDPEVVHPAAQILCELFEPVVHGDEPAPARELFDSTLDFLKGLFGPADAAPTEGEAEEGGLIGWRHPALFLVDPELESTLEKALNASHHPLPGPLTFHQDDEVVGVPGEMMTAALELFVQIIQHGIGQERRKRTPLGDPDAGFLKLPIHQSPGSQVFADEA